MAANNRPLSPHLQVYSLPLTGLLSIIHRITGLLLSFGFILFIYVLFAVTVGEGVYAAMQSFMSFWLLRLLYWSFIYALFFHLCHGIRHLLWDTGQTFDRAKLNRYAIAELIVSGLLVLITFIIT